MKKFLLLACFCPVLLISQPKWVCFTSSDAVSDFVFDNQTVWVVGKGGLSKIDQATGLSENFNSGNAPILSTANYAVARSADGTIWAGNQDGGFVIKKQNGSWDAFPATTAGLPFLGIYGILPAGPDKAWVFGSARDWANSTFFNFFLYENGQIAPVPAPAGLAINNYIVPKLVDETGQLWVAASEPLVGTGNKIARFDGAAWMVFGAVDFGANYSINGLTQTPDGKIWAVGYLNGSFPANTQRLLCFDGSQWTATDIPKPAATQLGNNPALLQTDAQGTLWIYDWPGSLWKFDPTAPAASAWLTVDLPTTLGWSAASGKIPVFDRFKIDVDGGWWFTSNYEGLYYRLYSFKDDVLKRWDNLGSSAIPTNDVRGVAIGPDNQKYMLADDGLLRFDPTVIGSEWTQAKPPPSTVPLDWQIETGLKFDKQGNQWFTETSSMFDSYLVKFDGQAFTKFQVPGPFGGFMWLMDVVFDIDADGHVWLPAGHFLIEMEPSGNFNYYEPAGPNGPSYYFNLVYRDPSDVLWALGGPYWYQKQPGGDWELKARFDALNQNFASGTDGFADLIVDKKGVAWFMPTIDAGTGPVGFCRLEGNDLQMVSTIFNQPATGILADAPNALWSLAVDSSNNLWGIAANLTSTGQSRLMKFDGANWTEFTLENSGFPGGVNHIAVDSFQNIWLSSSSGLMVFNENGVKNLGFLPDPPPDVSFRLDIWPNPASDGAVVKLPAGFSKGPVEWQIFDTSGRPVFFKKETETGGALDLKMTSFPTGVFQVEATTADGRAVGRLVKQ